MQKRILICKKIKFLHSRGFPKQSLPLEQILCVNEDLQMLRTILTSAKVENIWSLCNWSLLFNAYGMVFVFCGVGFFICFVSLKMLLKIIIVFQCLEENNAVVFKETQLKCVNSRFFSCSLPVAL